MKWVDANNRFHARFTYIWSALAFGLALFQPKGWSPVALIACTVALWHLYSVEQ